MRIEDDAAPPAPRAGRVVIAGGSGIVGREVARCLLDAGLEVDVLTRRPDRARPHLPAGARAVAWAAAPTDELAAILAGSLAVVNLAGEAIGPRPWTSGRKRAIRDSRIRATSALVEAIRGLPADRRPGALVNASGTDVYVDRGEAPATEATTPASDFLAEVCLEWEATASAAEPLGVRVVILRQAFVLASEAPVLRLLALPFRLFVGGRLGSGRQWFSWIHVEDLAALYRRAIESPGMRGIYNATAPAPVRNADLAHALGRALGRPTWLPVPAIAIRLALGEEATLVLGSRRAMPSRALEAGLVFRYDDLDVALRDVLDRRSR